MGKLEEKSETYISALTHPRGKETLPPAIHWGLFPELATRESCVPFHVSGRNQSDQEMWMLELGVSYSSLKGWLQAGEHGMKHLLLLHMNFSPMSPKCVLLHLYSHCPQIKTVQPLFCHNILWLWFSLLKCMPGQDYFCEFICISLSNWQHGWRTIDSQKN